ncbi:MAG: TerC family protein [Candidatus Kerfeldbacteria bacterium]|nr:TerC family protein [Candidatus Kerfeldbacteria bacterium]
MDPKLILFGILAITVITFLIADLGFFNRKAHKIPFKSALLQSLFWIGVSLIFAIFVYALLGPDPSSQFLTAYVTEKMLSVDNLFVILLIFNFFKLEEKYHHRVLFWGILGAILFRGVFILTGSIIIEQFHWVLYIFGAILLYTGFKLLKEKKEEHVNYHDSKILKFARKFLPFTTNHHEGKFFVREQGKLHATILFAIVLLVESTDIVFAIDSIPAAFSISQDPFIVFTSNIFAIMGLRALFFLIEHVIHRFHHLQKALSFILVFIGSKMLLGIFHIHISSVLSFAIIMSALGLALILSLMFPKKL